MYNKMEIGGWKMKNIKLVLCDVDGTLLNSKKEISPATVEAIKKLKQAGMLFGIATGRPYNGIKKKIVDWNIEEYVDVIVGMNGAQCYDAIHQTLNSYNLISVQNVQEIVTTYMNEGFYPSVYENQQMLMVKELAPAVRSAQLNCMETIIVQPERIWQEPREKILFGIEEGKMPIIQSFYQNHLSESYHAFKTQKDLFEFVDKSVSKSYGISQFCKMNGLEMQEVCVFGDTTNDVEMLRDSGLGICMSNGTQDAKDVSDFITKSNDEDGISWYVENYLI